LPLPGWGLGDSFSSCARFQCRWRTLVRELTRRIAPGSVLKASVLESDAPRQRGNHSQDTSGFTPHGLCYNAGQESAEALREESPP
jgi:hypothetical protein